jgi:hypothetical protein
MRATLRMFSVAYSFIKVFSLLASRGDCSARSAGAARWQATF